MLKSVFVLTLVLSRRQIQSPQARRIKKGDLGIRLSYRPARLNRLARRYIRQPYAGVNFIPQSVTMNLATVEMCYVAMSKKPKVPISKKGRGWVTW
jgi:hypothetical protein